MHLYTYLDRMMFLSNLDGTIYYLKKNEQNHLSEIYKSDVSLTKETLIYSHEGQGNTNNNIAAFYVDPKTKIIRFIAMNESNWATYEITEGAKNATLISKQVDPSIPYDPLYESDGSDKFSGIVPIKSPFPNDNYELYFNKGEGLYDFSPLFKEIFTGDSGIGMRIKDLDSGKDVKYMDTYMINYDIQYMR